ncbi:MAG: tetratricopeptide repeat protein, partial [Mariprofundaceae bacterium]|nr:tetratricopeptide repeat protein [Mariprofundaceae bacterium]
MRMSTPALSILLAAALLGSAWLPVSPAGMAYAAVAESKSLSNKNINSIRSLLHNGNPNLAKSKAFKLLKTGQVNDRQRRSLLRVIAVAEEMGTSLHEYTDADVAIAAWKNLLKEFVSPDDAAGIRWKICWLYWKKGDAEGSSRAAEELLKENPGSPQAREARLLLAKMNIENGKLHSARKNLMKYMLDSETDTDQAQGLAWMAVVDFMEQRNDAALENMLKAINLAPGLVSSHVTLLSSYVQLLYMHHNQDAFLRQAKRFFSLYLDRHEAMLIRLMYANVLAEQGKTNEALQSYE